MKAEEEGNRETEKKIQERRKINKETEKRKKGRDCGVNTEGWLD